MQKKHNVHLSKIEKKWSIAQCVSFRTQVSQELEPMSQFTIQIHQEIFNVTSVILSVEVTVDYEDMW